MVLRWCASWPGAPTDEEALAKTGVAQRMAAHRPTTTAFRTYLRSGRQGHGARRSRALRRGPGAAVRVFGRKRAYRRSTSVGPGAYETFKERVTIVVARRNVREAGSTTRRPLRGASEAAGQGLEPQLPEPESGVLPLDDPAGLGRIVAA